MTPSPCGVPRAVFARLCDPTLLLACAREEERRCESDLLEGVATATRLGASAISISFAGPEATDPNALSVDAGGAANGTTGCPAEAKWPHDAPGVYSTPGHLVFAASGDYGRDVTGLGAVPCVSGGNPPSSPLASSASGYRRRRVDA